MLQINEVFYSIQGEGINMGLPAVFVRTAGCQLRCSFCDTKYAFEEGREVTTEQLDKEIKRLCSEPTFIIFTGGEPTLQMDGIVEYIEESRIELDPDFCKIGLETNGVAAPHPVIEEYFDHIAVSPKLSSACEHGYSVDILKLWRGLSLSKSVEFKFVICSEEDVVEATALICDELNLLGVYRIPVVFQPNGFSGDYNGQLDWLVEKVKRDELPGIRVLPQLHRIIWGGVRGV